MWQWAETSGGHWTRAVTFPKQMLVDYVRVYAQEGEVEENVLANAGLESGSLSAWTPYDEAGVNDPGAFVESTNCDLF